MKNIKFKKDTIMPILARLISHYEDCEYSFEEGLCFEAKKGEAKITKVYGVIKKDSELYDEQYSFNISVKEMFDLIASNQGLFMKKELVKDEEYLNLIWLNQKNKFQPLFDTNFDYVLPFLKRVLEYQEKKGLETLSESQLEYFLNMEINSKVKLMNKAK